MNLDEINIKDLFLCNGFDLRPYGFNGSCSMTEPYFLTIFLILPEGDMKGVKIEVPTKGKRKEINWLVFKHRFIDACTKLNNHEKTI